MSTALSASPSAPADPARRPRVPASTAVVVAAAVVATLALAWFWRWTADDAFINLRAVRSILDGDGPVFNAGQRVEVGTSPLWLWLLAGVAAVLPVDVAWIAVTLGGVGSAVGVALACLGAAALHRPAEVAGSRRFPFPAGVLVFLALPATWTFLTSGLETGLTFAWLGAVWFGTARIAASRATTRPWWLLVVVGLGPLIRPDLAIVTGLLGVWLLVAVPSSWPRRLRDVIVAGAVPAAYQVFRMGYYGLLVPSAAVAKESGRSLWARGWGYLLDLGAPYLLAVPLSLCAALLVLAARQARWNGQVLGLVGVTLLAAALQAAFVVRVGGDFMHGRLLLPALFQALCPVALIPVAVSRARRGALAGAGTLVLAAGLVAWAGVCAASLRISYPESLSDRLIADERGFYVSATDSPNPVTVEDHGAGVPVAWGEQVARSAQRGADLVFAQNVTTGRGTPAPLLPLGRSDDRTYLLVDQAGYLGYAAPADVVVLDLYGLTDPVGSHLEPQRPRRAGHEKRMPLSWGWARYGEDLPVVQAPTPSLSRVTHADLRAARAALACGALADLVEAASAPLTAGRFWDNVTGSVGRTSLRIPSDPRDAEAAFC